MIRRDFFELVDYATSNGIGVKFSTNGTFLDRRAAAASGVDGLPRRPGQPRRRRCGDQRRRPRRRVLRPGPGGDGPSRRRRVRSVQDLRRRHPPQRRPARRLEGARRLLRRPAAHHPTAPVRPRAPTRGTSSTRPRTSNARSTAGCSPTATTCSPATASSTSTPSARRCRGSTCAAPGAVVCLIDPVGDVYACPFVIHEQFRAGSVREPGGFAAVWRDSALFHELRRARRRRRVRQLRKLRRLPGRVHGRQVLHRDAARRPRPRVRSGPRRSGTRRHRHRVDAAAIGRSLPPRQVARQTTDAAAHPGPPDADDVGRPRRGGLPARHVPERSDRGVGVRRRHHDNRLRQPGRLQRHPRPRLAQGDDRVRPRRPQGRCRHARRVVARRPRRRLRARRGGDRRAHLPGHPRASAAARASPPVPACSRCSTPSSPQSSPRCGWGCRGSPARRRSPRSPPSSPRRSASPSPACRPGSSSPPSGVCALLVVRHAGNIRRLAAPRGARAELGSRRGGSAAAVRSRASSRERAPELGGVQTAHAVDAGTGRGRGRAQVQAGCSGRPRPQRHHRAGEQLAQVGDAAGDVAADVVGVVRLDLGRGGAAAAEDRSPEAGGEAFDLALDRIGHVDGRPVGHVAVGPQRVATRRRPGAVEQARLGDEHERTLRVPAARRRSARRRRSRRTSRRRGPWPPSASPDRATAPGPTGRSRA